MFALSFMEVLAKLIWKAQLPPHQHLDIVQRFSSLRSYGLLPRGRERRAQPLSQQEIANGILGLAADGLLWAGHVALILSKLQPAGGDKASYKGAKTLQETIATLITIPDLPLTFRLELSCAEYWTNAAGFAALELQTEDCRRTIYFVPSTTRLSRQDSSIETILEDVHRPSLDRRLVLTERFFVSLRGEIAASAYTTPPSPEDGWEYDEEDIQSAKLARLGVKPGAHFLNIGVDNQVTWPKEETKITFDRYELIALPKTKDNVQSVHIDLTTNRLNLIDAKTVISRFLSILSWCSDNYAIMQGGWSGNPNPVPVPRRDLAFRTTSQWAFDRKIPATDEIRRALALYREARNAHHNFLVGYAVVSYCKVIEISNPHGSDVRNWIKNNFRLAQADSQFARIANDFNKIRGNETAESYLWASCRVATAHGSPKVKKSDPDDSVELTRLDVAADVFHILARIFISKDLGVSASMYSST
jgi:hypothetical protein